MKNSTIRLVLILTATCVLSAFALSLVYNQTKPKIEEQEKQAVLKAVSQVLPPFDNDPIEDGVTLDIEGVKKTFYIGKSKGSISGVAFVTDSLGYSGTVHLMMGVDTKNRVSGIDILKHQETPGLGAKAEKPKFRDQFKDKKLVDLNVRQDGGKIDALTAATITSRAATKAVRDGLELYEKNKKEILNKAGKDESV